MPQIKPLAVSNGTSTVTYTPGGSSATSTLFVNRGQTLGSISKVTSDHPTASPGANQRQRLVLNKRKEVTVDGIVQQQEIGVYDLGIVNSPNGSTRAERVAALTEFRNLLSDADVVASIVDNEAWY